MACSLCEYFKIAKVIIEKLDNSSRLDLRVGVMVTFIAHSFPPYIPSSVSFANLKKMLSFTYLLPPAIPPTITITCISINIEYIWSMKGKHEYWFISSKISILPICTGLIVRTSSGRYLSWTIVCTMGWALSKNLDNNRWIDSLLSLNSSGVVVGRSTRVWNSSFQSRMFESLT